MIKSLRAREHDLSDTFYQLDVLNNRAPDQERFSDKMKAHDLNPLRPTGIEVLQVNLGKMCNQACKHCHVDAGPDRKEIMTRETMQHILDALERHDIPTLDITGGAPELNPHFRWFAESASELGCHIIDRCNLTIILANKRFYDLPEFFKKHHIELVCSLPHYTKERCDRQRGAGVFDDSVKALQQLNEVGYGIDGSGLELNLVYNPAGAFLPASQEEMEHEFKRNLKKDYGIEFNSLFVITNLPISRFLEYLIASHNYEEYMQELIDAFNPAAAQNVMCRDMISVGWDGKLYDCDFNQMLEVTVEDSAPQHISEFDKEALEDRNIMIDQHCYGCTAGAGSSCGGNTT